MATTSGGDAASDACGVAPLDPPGSGIRAFLMCVALCLLEHATEREMRAKLALSRSRGPHSVSAEAQARARASTRTVSACAVWSFRHARERTAERTDWH